MRDKSNVKTARDNGLDETQRSLIQAKIESTSRATSKERYLKAGDFLELQVQNMQNHHVGFIEPVKIFVGLIDLFNLERPVAFCFYKDL